MEADWKKYPKEVPPIDPEDYPNSDFVLCITAKFGDIKNYGYIYQLLAYNHMVKKWYDESWNVWEDTIDFHTVAYWTELPDRPVLLSEKLEKL